MRRLRMILNIFAKNPLEKNNYNRIFWSELVDNILKINSPCHPSINNKVTANWRSKYRRESRFLVKHHGKSLIFAWFLRQNLPTVNPSSRHAYRGFILVWHCRAEGALTFECHRRTRSTLVFVCPRNADFRIFRNFWFFPGRNGVRARRSRRHRWPSSCSLDSLRCVSSHWSRHETLDRSKLDFAGVTRPDFRF